jgi:lactate dehydrogenase-like 2-hydroxyacid dehydrogenase
LADNSEATLAALAGDRARTILSLATPMAALHKTLGNAFDLASLADQDDPNAFLRAHGADVLGIFAKGGDIIDATLMNFLPSLRQISFIGSGYEGVDLLEARRRGIVVTNTPSVNADDVADHALALFLAHVRHLAEGMTMVRCGHWTSTERGPVSRSVSSLSVGIVGLGAIGNAIASRLEPFGCALSWWGPREKPSRWPKARSLLELAGICDVLVVAARADRTNDRLIDREVLDALGAHGLLVNISRGSIVDEDALIDALRCGRLGGAALDVFIDEPTPAERWAGVPNVLLTPHIAGWATGAMSRMVQLVRDEFSRLLAGDAPLHPIHDGRH